MALPQKKTKNKREADAKWNIQQAIRDNDPSNPNHAEELTRIDVLEQKKQAGTLLPAEVGEYNRYHAMRLIAESIAETGRLPTATLLAEKMGVSLPTATKHLETVIMSSQNLKTMAKRLNVNVMAQHYHLIMDKDKATSGLVNSWYDHFEVPMNEDKKPEEKGDKGRIQINIVVSKQREVSVQEAEVISEQ